MAVYKCKMCGGSFDIEEGQTVVTCEFCGTCQTVHSFDDEKKIVLFKRANNLRFKNEFDKAAGIYETLVAEFPKEAEAYWGLVLCKYGIEYVDDPATGKKIPTCHRTQFSPIFDDTDYKHAIKYADVVAKEVYEKEAEAIAKLQKEIIEISSKEDPFDIFICYKESDKNGERTKDSVLAQDIYKELTDEGYKVFFARITLEDMIGSQYEPLIFAALHSSKVMLHVTTSGDNSESVWVRNEWSRYLALIAKGEKKSLIPCYKDMDAYDLPDEMENFQGINFSKLGAMQDLLYGLKKIIRRPVAASKKKSLLAEETEADIYESYLKKGNILLSKGMWDEANETFEKAAKIVEKSGRAYVGMMLANTKSKTVADFINNSDLCDLRNEFFEKAVANADLQCENEIAAIKRIISEQDDMENLVRVKKLIREKHYQDIIPFLDNDEFADKHRDDILMLINKDAVELLTLPPSISLGCSLKDLIKFYKNFEDISGIKELIAKLHSKEKEVDDFMGEQFVESLKFEKPGKLNIHGFEELLIKYKKNKIVFESNSNYYSFAKDRYLAIQKDLVKYLKECGPTMLTSHTFFHELFHLESIIKDSNLEDELQDLLLMLKKAKDEICVRNADKRNKAKKVAICLTTIACVAVVTLIVILCTR